MDPRWNSTFYTGELLIKVEDAVKSTVAFIDKELPRINPNEWLLLKDLVTVLKPLEYTTKEIFIQIYFSGSLVIFIVNGLKVVFT